MHRKHHTAKGLCLALCLSMTMGVGYPLSTLALSQTEQLQQQQAQWRQEIATYQSRLDDLKGDQSREAEYQSTLSSQIAVYNQQLDTYQAHVDSLNAEISTKESEISRMDSEILANQQIVDQKNAEIDQLEADKADTIERLKNRMITDYKSGQTSTLDMLLSAQDFGQFLTNMEYVKRNAAYDQELTDTLNQQVDQIDEAKGEVEATIATIESQKSEVQAALDDLAVKRDEVTSAQNDLQATANVVNQKLQESKNASDQISAKYSAAQQAIADREKRIAQADAEISNIINGDYNNGGGSGQIVGPSNYIYPLPGYRITSGYGPRQYGSGYHYGIDIGAPAGTGIKASRGGTVLVSMFGYSGSGYGGYGNVIVIKHGDGTYTLYGHMNARYVNVGDTVSQGQTIGAVGSTGDSTGNHLHFEIRIGTQKVNPLNYVTPC